jgi:internalin A
MRLFITLTSILIAVGLLGCKAAARKSQLYELQATPNPVFMSFCNDLSDPEVTVTVRALLRAVDEVDCAAGEQRLTLLTELYMNKSNIRDLRPLAGLTKLEKLELEQNRIIDASPLSTLSALRRLDLRKNEIRDLSFVTNLKELKDLDVGFNQIHDISPLATLTKLSELLLPSNPLISDLTPLRALDNLSTIDVSDLPIGGRLDVLGQKPQIETIVAYRCGMTDLRWLEVLQPEGLEELYAAENQISDLSPLAANVYLNTLVLGKNRIVSLAPLASIRSLDILQVEDNPGITEFHSLVKAGVLKTLDISRTGIRDIRSLPDVFPGLENIRASGLGLTDVSAIRRYRYLFTNSLDFSKNALTDISPVYQFTELYSLNLDGNPATNVNFAALEAMKNLKYLSFDVNRLPDPVSRQRMRRLIELTFSRR